MADERTPEREEIRFAVVLNGGVSLAVWMGGVASELDALIRAHDGFGLLMDRLRVRARADVISGTSAGGINGAALALSQVNNNADLSVLRDLWADQGRMETLLQRPFRGEPASLLRGEAYFLPELTKAMQQLTANWDPAPIDDRPMDLTVTTTLLDGALWETTDGFGQRLTQRRHDGRFRFVRMRTDSGREIDQFDPEKVVGRLGLAARASAGFPVAFEPTYIPVDAPDGAADGAGRPDMAEHATWRMTTVHDGGLRDRSRYAVDGGLLANTPTKPALEAVQRMRADRNVERVITLISPRGAADQDSPPAAFAAPPTLLRSGLGMMSALTSQGNRSFVDEVEEHNHRVQARRGTRAEVLASLGHGEVDPDTAVERLRATANSVFPFYRDLRRRRVGREVAGQAPRPEGWSDRRIHEVISASRTADGLAVPYVPKVFTTEGRLPPVPNPDSSWQWGWETVLDVADIALDYLDALGRVWPAGGATLGDARAQVHDATAHARWFRDAYQRVWDEPHSLTPDAYVRLRRVAYQWLIRGEPAALEALEAFGPAVVDELAPLSAGLLRAAHLEDPSVDEPALTILTRAGGTAGGLLAAAASSVLDAVLAPTTRGALTPYERTVLKWSFDEPWRRISEVATSGPNARRRTWALLLSLHVVSWTVGDELPTANTREVRLALISAATTNHFATLSRSVEEKLGGASLSRFSGFLKQSWRMNDWTWGRCDAASMLTRILVTPERVRRLAVRSGQMDAGAVVDLLFAAALGVAESAAAVDALNHPGAVGVLGPLRAAAIREVAALLAEEADRPSILAGPEDQSAGPVTMPGLTDLLTYPRHVLIAVQELRTIAASIRADQADGASPGSHGELFLAENAELLHALYAPPPAGSGEWLALGIRSLRAFDRAGIGREPLEREAASDQIIRTAVTSAAVAATVLDGPYSGLGTAVTRPVTRGLKGLLMLPYWVTRGLTSTGKTARYLGLLGLAVGGVLLVLSVLGLIKDEAAGVAALLGGGALVTAIAYAALRSGSHLHAGVLVAGLVLLPTLGLLTDTTQRSASVVVVGLVIVGGLIVLGSLPVRVQVPEDDTADAGAGRASGRQPWRGALRVLISWSAVAIPAVAAGVFSWAAARNAGRAEGGLASLAAESPLPLPWPGRTGEHLGWDAVIGVAIATVVLIAVLLTRSLQRPLGRWDGRDLRPYTGAAAVTARWSIGYGLLFGAFAAAVLGWWQPDAHAATLWALLGGLVALALILLLVIPGAVFRATRSRLRERTHRQAIYGLSLGVGTAPAQNAGAELGNWLIANDSAYRFLVKKPSPPTLTRAGKAMAAELAEPTTG